MRQVRCDTCKYGDWHTASRGKCEPCYAWSNWTKRIDGKIEEPVKANWDDPRTD